jgi:hypothetical protein
MLDDTYRRARRLVRVASVALLAGLGACADEQEALIVLHTSNWEGGACGVDANSEEGLALGQLDLRGGSGYFTGVVLRNQLVAQGNETNSGVDNSEMQLRDVDVLLQMPQAPEILDAIEAEDPAMVDFNVTLPSDSLPGESNIGVIFEAIPATTAMRIADAVAGLPAGSAPIIEVHQVYHARRTGNNVGGVGEFEAREYIFPVRLCVDCLFTCSGCMDMACPGNTGPIVGGVCGSTQDLPYGPAACEPPSE